MVLSLDERYGTVESVTIVAETQVMYDLTVEEVHTFAVGAGRWVVHNECPVIQLPPGSLMEQRAIKIKQRYSLDRIFYEGSMKTWWRQKNIGLSYHRLTNMALDDLGETIARQQTGSLHAISGYNSSILKNIPNYSGVLHPGVRRITQSGIIYEENELIFDTLRKGMSGEGIDRFTDTESKLLEYYARRLDGRSRGWIDLYTLNAPCKSCGGRNRFHKQGVIGQFADRFPNISLRVFYTHGIYPPSS